MPGYPHSYIINGTEIIMKVFILPHVTIIGIYRSPKIPPVQQLLGALTEVFMLCSSQFNIFIGDFNINWLDEANRRPLHNFFINESKYGQSVCSNSTDNQALIDHLYEFTQITS